MKIYPKKGAKWYIERQLIGGKYHYQVTDGWYGDWPIVYWDDRVAYDNPYRIPQYIKKYISKHAQEMRFGTL